ncbi:hypothetical protein [Oceanobacillus halotolerans]|uniref:hypothetical protein n=1 Tax=Oceanobacillus halotolerans TaxID=2663380 RepID=UPI0013DD394B|nr:hypothetical protein [Oceanobacillus halotolerans]
MMIEVMIGVDIGGTPIKLGIIDKNGHMLHKWEIPTNKADNGVRILDDIWNLSVNIRKLS